ncbi:16S rRNA (adenine1518-N6/adenine1519-N6)-dimethyltransferase [Methylomagnum ishizawai]|uniref:Ribosomal RNA small subunit methyltransferase A n=1 Tax=Methylomagnum ishizawai TaxID=1760988 RepID=A0A1Y6D4C5_9GAMM|nr:16S rRNA (adenine(1518)-N(6)/adenine(1519)-N(6))-dimethyltransferase RsmA [Methylomagnum ishizawai]SMF97280.1 16S rRNA (adenine1518-N6/adenine1519-N6)-dimethyltransferase [Methylomagnum ishizawai]
MSHIPRKRFGQNFLRDTAVVHRILMAIAPGLEEHLVEIGPGEGAMTQSLLPNCRRLDAVEIDRDLAEGLRRKFAADPRFRLHSADALRFDFRGLREGNEKLRVVGNLPYNISTPLMFHLFGQVEGIHDMHFMLQNEVVDRLAAEPGSADYGRLSIMAGYHCRAEKLFEVPPESFHPRPKVVSAIVRLMPHATPPVEVDPQVLGKVVATAFSQRRKTLRNSVKTLFEEREIEAMGIDPNARAETLGLEDYARMAQRWVEKSR